MTRRNGSFLLAVIAILGSAACNKEVKSLPEPTPGSIDTSSYLQLSVSGIQITGNQLYALVSLQNPAGQPVVTNRKITLDYIQGEYKTDKINLGKGEFRLSKFIVVKANDTAVYAAPRANTPRASEVANPLSMAVSVTQKGINSAAVQVVKIAVADAPAAFGYSAGDFGYQSYLTLGVKLRINVGQVAYDSLPGKVTVDATNSEGNHWTREIDLQKGLTLVTVPEEYSQFRFEAAKWNVIALKNYTRQELQTGMTISLEAHREPKKLVKELIYIENSAGLIPDSRTEYFYNVMGKLSEINNYQRSLQVSGLHLTNIYKFRYNGMLLDSINRFGPDHSSTGYTNFSYTGERISNIRNRSYDQETGAAMEYIVSGNSETITADYLFSNGNTMNYKIFVRDGNKISDQAQTSTGGAEGGTYEYDNSVNPKHQLGWSDLYFSNYSKNNLTREQKGYGGAFPSAIPYKFEYTYDADGYPSEVYVSYKGFTSQQHLYRIKKVYTYQ